MSGSDFLLWLFLLVSLSALTYRLGRIVVLDDIFGEARDAVLDRLTTIEHGTDGKKRPLSLPEQNNMLHLLPAWRRKLVTLIGCPFCITGWISGVAVLVTYFTWQTFPAPVLMWFATWTGGLVFWAIIDSE